MLVEEIKEKSKMAAGKKRGINSFACSILNCFFFKLLFCFFNYFLARIYDLFLVRYIS